MSNTLESKLPHSTPGNNIEEEDEEEKLLNDKSTITWFLLTKNYDYVLNYFYPFIFFRVLLFGL